MLVVLHFSPTVYLGCEVCDVMRSVDHIASHPVTISEASILLFFLFINHQPPPPRQGWNIEGHLLAKSPSAAVIPMTLDGQINMSGSLSNSGNNVGLICDDKRICSIENQWEVASAARYRLRFASNLKHIVGFGCQLISVKGPILILNRAVRTKAQTWSFVVAMSWEQKICPLFTARRCQNCRVFASCYKCCFATAATRLKPTA